MLLHSVWGCKEVCAYVAHKQSKVSCAMPVLKNLKIGEKVGYDILKVRTKTSELMVLIGLHDDKATIYMKKRAEAYKKEVLSLPFFFSKMTKLSVVMCVHKLVEYTLRPCLVSWSASVR